MWCVGHPSQCLFALAWWPPSGLLLSWESFKWYREMFQGSSTLTLTPREDTGEDARSLEPYNRPEVREEAQEPVAAAWWDCFGPLLLRF